MFSITTSLAVICPVYPGGLRSYGGEFVMRRMQAYRERHGIRATVIEVNAANTVPRRHEVQGTDVLRVTPEALGGVLARSDIRVLGAHSVEQPVWDAVKPNLESLPLVVWVHGFEARDWRELAFNFTAAELRDLQPRLDAANAQRHATMSEVFAHPKVTPIFVSQFMRGVAEEFAGVQAPRARVIHNMIDPRTFPYSAKPPALRKRILWVRSFAARNYANDISRNFVIALSQRPEFASVEVSVFGDGRFFRDMTAPLAEFDNVTVTQGFLDTEQLREQHAAHGVMLVPSRWDSQGLTCGEAMAAGLVPLTNRVAALPEFVDNEVAVIAPPNDHEALVEGYLELLHDPDRFAAMSRAASERSVGQCGPDRTLDPEARLIQDMLGTKI